MAERKSGSAKPPTIDLTARKAAEAADKTAAETKATDSKADGPTKASSTRAGARKAGPTPSPAAKTETAAPKPGESGTTARTPDSGKTDSKTSSGSDAAASASPTAGTSAAKATSSAARPGDAGPRPGAAASRPSSVPPRQSGSGLGAGITGGVLGGILGLAVAYGLAVAGYWPGGAGSTPSDAPPAITQADLDALAAQLRGNFVRQDELAAAVAAGEGAVDLTPELQALSARLDRLETAPAGSETSDAVAAVQADLAALAERLDAAVLTAGDTSSVDATLSGMTERFDAVAARLDEIDARTADLAAAETVSPAQLSGVADNLGALEASVLALQTQVASLTDLAAQTAAANEGNGIDVRLPLALSGLEAALGSGASFAAELAIVQQALPSVTAPEALAAASETGLPEPGGLATAFAARMPEILGAKPINADAGWSEQALERVKALVALRPAGPVEGDDAEAVLSRIEAALTVQDFETAAELLAALPADMQAAMGELGEQIVLLGAGQSYVEQARRAALAAAGGAS